MIEDVRDTRSEKDGDDAEPPKEPELPKLSLKGLIANVISSRKYNDTSMYHSFPSSLRPPVIAGMWHWHVHWQASWHIDDPKATGTSTLTAMIAQLEVLGVV